MINNDQVSVHLKIFCDHYIALDAGTQNLGVKNKNSLLSNTQCKFFTHF